MHSHPSALDSVAEPAPGQALKKRNRRALLTTVTELMAMAVPRSWG